MFALAFALVLGAASPPIDLVLVSREGGINPGTETITVSPTGEVRVERQRLAPSGVIVFEGKAGEETLAKIRALLESSRFRDLPAVLNRADGAGVAFDWELRVSDGTSERTVRACRFGAPPPEPRFVQLIRALRELLMPVANRPAP